MARPEITGKKHGPAEDVDAFSVSSFCRRHGISPQLFYKLKPQGLMPTTFRLGTRVLISRESAERWRAERDSASAGKKATKPKQSRYANP
ncbi:MULTISPECIES: hypothetical protein [Bradyrhizobium]|uniref:hypothetical protein n=1 Tax=Bradyrhizobium TaxID=374 RepID=UPI0009FC0464|nr:hypothetical protein [Bradyrhizobium sp. CCBAU 15544]